MKTRILITIMLSVTLAVQAQNSNLLYFMNLPQNRNLNPAFSPTDSVNIVLPLGGIGLTLNNNFLNFDTFIKQGSSDSLISFLHPDFDTDEFLGKIRNHNSVDFDAMFQLFGLGFKAGRGGYIFFDINERIQSRASIPGDLFELVLKGNEQFAGSYIDLSALRADMRVFHEAGLGYSRNFTKNLRLGFKGKLLFGIASASVTNQSLGIRVDQDYTHVLDADASIDLSGPFVISRNAEGNISDFEFDDENLVNSILLKGNKNLGFAFDAGVTYNLSEKIFLSAALTDIGFIRWKNNATRQISNGQFSFGGIELTDVVNGNITFREAREELLDSLENVFSPYELNAPYSTFLPTNLNIGGSYRLSENFTLGVLSSSNFMGKQFKESLTMSANMNLGSSLLASVSYTASNHRFDNLGAGIALRLSIFQFYIMSDRIPVFWNRIYTDSGNNGNGSFIVPANFNTFDLRFGMNLVFGHRKKKVPVVCEPVQEQGPEPGEIVK